MRLLGAVLLGAACASPALAQPAGEGAARQVFRQADGNGDGRVTWDEAWGELQRRFAQADSNRDGGVSQEEWLAAQGPGRPARPGQPAPDAQRLRERRAGMFRAIDANRDGKVTLDELRPVAEAWFRAFDANGDGALVPEELPRPPQRPGTP